MIDAFVSLLGSLSLTVVERSSVTHWIRQNKPSDALEARMDVANLTLQGYILGLFPKFRKGRDARVCKPEDTHTLLSLSRPQGGACCGLSSLRL